MGLRIEQNNVGNEGRLAARKSNRWPAAEGGTYVPALAYTVGFCTICRDIESEKLSNVCIAPIMPQC